jgi:hypothetical protein
MRIFAAVTLFLLLCGSAFSGTVDPDLEAKLVNAGPDELLKT